MKAIDALEHITTEGERWDTLAWNYYGNPFMYSRIVEANPSVNISTRLPSGLVLLIPIIPADEASTVLANEDLPPWKRS